MKLETQIGNLTLDLGSIVDNKVNLETRILSLKHRVTQKQRYLIENLTFELGNIKFSL